MSSSRRWKRWCVLPVAAMVLGAAGCAADDGSNKSPEAAESTSQAISKESEAADGPGDRVRRGHPGGPEFLLVAALRELDLSAAQRNTIEGALAKVAATREHGPKDRGPFVTLAEGVRAGKIDEAAVLAKAGADEPSAEDRARVATAIQTLHVTLTKEQRRALVTAIESHMDEHGPPGPAPSGGRSGMDGPGPLGFFLHEVDLTDAQREAIHRALEAQKPSEADHEAMKKQFEGFHAQMRTRLESFAGDAIDAKAFLAPPEGAEAGGPPKHLERVVKALAVVVPILEPAQRERLAALLEKGPPMGPPPRK